MGRYKILFLGIFIIGIILRFAWLGQYPSGFFRDEAALGYNAYSIWQTGKDEYGMNFPTVFRSFEVFFLPAYVYLSAPVVGILGLSETTTRFWSAFSGVITLVLIWLISWQIWKDKKIALLSLLVLSISPWHIFYSRGAFEGNLALMFFCGGFLFWLKFLEKFKIRWFLCSLIAFVLSMYSYQAERLVVIMFALSALIFSWKSLWNLKKQLVLPMILAFILLIPILSLTFTPGGYHRALDVSIFAGKEKLSLGQISSLYFSYFSPRNIFFEGDYFKQRSVENFSVFYSWMLPFLIAGLIFVFKKKTLGGKLFLSWILFAPIPAAITTDPFHTYRSLLLYVPFAILIAIGLSKLKIRYLFLIGPVILITLSYFLFSYFVLNPVMKAKDWDFGYKEMVSFIKSQNDATKVVVDDPWTEPYIHFLFFGKVNPSLYHKEVAKMGSPENYYYKNSDEIRPNKFGKYEFRSVDWPTERGDKGTIFVMSGARLPESEFKTDPNVVLLKEISYPYRDVAFRIVKIIN